MNRIKYNIRIKEVKTSFFYVSKIENKKDPALCKIFLMDKISLLR